MPANLDNMYEEVLRGEFAASDSALPMDGADVPIHDEFGAQVPPAAVEEAPAGGEGPGGLARYRNAAVVGAGGLACAAMGAFLGGLGGFFTIAPAVAHPLASSATTGPSSDGTANVANEGGATASGTEAVVTAALTSLSGSLTQNAAPLQWLTAQSGSLPDTAAATPTDLPPIGTKGAGDGSTGAGSGCTTITTDLGLGCVLGNLTTALGSVGGLPSDPTEELGSLAPSLTGVVTDVTGTLADLGSLLPISSLPLPAGGLPALGLPAIAGVPGIGGLGGLGALGSLGSLGNSLPGPSTLLANTGGITALLDGVTSAATGATGAGSTAPSLPSLPLGGNSGSVPGLPSVPGLSSVPGLPSVPSLPVTASASGKVLTPTGSASGSTSSGTNGTTTTVTVPLPSVPLPVSTPPVSVGGVSVGVSSSGSGSGLTLTLP